MSQGRNDLHSLLCPSFRLNIRPLKQSMNKMEQQSICLFYLCRPGIIKVTWIIALNDLMWLGYTWLTWSDSISVLSRPFLHFSGYLTYIIYLVYLVLSNFFSLHVTEIRCKQEDKLNDSSYFIIRQTLLKKILLIWKHSNNNSQNIHDLLCLYVYCDTEEWGNA